MLQTGLGISLRVQWFFTDDVLLLLFYGRRTVNETAWRMYALQEIQQE